jgi:four helix bundle protein
MTKECQMTKPELLDDLSDKDESLELVFWGLENWQVGAVSSTPSMLREEAVTADQKFDLEERTTLFGERIIRFCKKVPTGPTNNALISQLVRSGTSVGANYCEADDAVSKKDFKNKIGTCRKEARETKYWLRMIATAEENLKDEARELWMEAREIHLIFCKIFRNS